MASTIEIANRALTKLGSDRLLALTDNTTAGRTMNSMFAQVRDAELRRNRWAFTLRRDSLIALSAAPAWGFSFAYPLPPDFLSLVQVNDYYIRPLSKSKALWAVESGSILTDIGAPLKIRYVSRVENAGLFDPLFAEALACKLAFEACETITQSTTKKQSFSGEYKAALSEAARCNAIENPPDELPSGTWLDSREGWNVGAIDGRVDVTYSASGMVVR